MILYVGAMTRHTAMLVWRSVTESIHIQKENANEKYAQRLGFARQIKDTFGWQLRTFPTFVLIRQQRQENNE